jgi:uncharacterized protein
MPVLTDFTPFASLAGGAMIGLAAVLLMLFHGRIAGISGIAVQLFPPFADKEALGRLAFVIGLAVAPWLVFAVTGQRPPMSLQAAPMMLIVAGLLVGFGSVYGNGCTSGHGVCGLSRLSLRSLVATLVFIATAIATVSVIRHGV